MPPPLLFDPSDYDLTRVVVTREEIYEALPHRDEFMLLDGVLMIDLQAERLIAFADITADAWWARGHLPNQPILPGALMVEMAGHAATYYIRRALGHSKFLAFTALDECKFRGLIEPPCRLLILGTTVDIRPRRYVCAMQGIVNDKMVFEAKLTGIPIG